MSFFFWCFTSFYFNVTAKIHISCTSSVDIVKFKKLLKYCKYPNIGHLLFYMAMASCVLPKQKQKKRQFLTSPESIQCRRGSGQQRALLLQPGETFLQKSSFRFSLPPKQVTWIHFPFFFLFQKHSESSDSSHSPCVYVHSTFQSVIFSSSQPLWYVFQAGIADSALRLATLTFRILWL